jgi:AraC-like DNA-binding protein
MSLRISLPPPRPALRRSLVIFLLLVLVPISWSAARYFLVDPDRGTWQTADRSSAGLLSPAAKNQEALIRVYAARTVPPPYRHLRMRRLSQARSALLSADGNFTTVTEIATLFGFVELGRFSVEYRKMFGESPSQTLQRADPGRVLAIGGWSRHRNNCLS